VNEASPRQHLVQFDVDELIDVLPMLGGNSEKLLFEPLRPGFPKEELK
jgi:hypothetical protein